MKLTRLPLYQKEKGIPEYSDFDEFLYDAETRPRGFAESLEFPIGFMLQLLWHLIYLLIKKQLLSEDDFVEFFKGYSSWKEWRFKL